MEEVKEEENEKYKEERKGNANGRQQRKEMK
jgi:hypothetical protein